MLIKIFTHDNRGVLGMTRYVYDETDSFKSKQNLYYMFDDLGSVTAITDDTGTPVQMYMYDAYGNVTNAQNDPINNFAFVGRYGGWKDWDTGLTQFLHRWYDSRDGRWLSRDPIGVDGGVNLYNYTDNNPVNRVDVTGLLAVNATELIRKSVNTIKSVESCSKEISSFVKARRYSNDGISHCVAGALIDRYCGGDLSMIAAAFGKEWRDLTDGNPKSHAEMRDVWNTILAGNDCEKKCKDNKNGCNSVWLCVEKCCKSKSFRGMLQ